MKKNYKKSDVFFEMRNFFTHVLIRNRVSQDNHDSLVKYIVQVTDYDPYSHQITSNRAFSFSCLYDAQKFVIDNFSFMFNPFDRH